MENATQSSLLHSISVIDGTERRVQTSRATSPLRRYACYGQRYCEHPMVNNHWINWTDHGYGWEPNKSLQQHILIGRVNHQSYATGFRGPIGQSQHICLYLHLFRVVRQPWIPCTHSLHSIRFNSFMQPTIYSSIHPTIHSPALSQRFTPERMSPNLHYFTQSISVMGRREESKLQGLPRN